MQPILQVYVRTYGRNLINGLKCVNQGFWITAFHITASYGFFQWSFLDFYGHLKINVCIQLCGIFNTYHQFVGHDTNQKYKSSPFSI